MKKGTYRVLEVLRYTSLIGVILLGFITITGTSTEDTKTSVSDTRERGIYKFVVTTEVDGGGFDYSVDTSKYDMEKDEELVEEKTEYFDTADNLRREIEDDDGDGELDYENEFDYGSFGITEGRYGYYDKDGILQISNVTRYTYDPDAGNNLKTQELDNDYDGAFLADAAHQYTYVQLDGEWYLAEDTYDSDGDLETNYTDTYDYDVVLPHNLLSAQYWFGDKDYVMSEVLYLYDGDDHLQMTKIDFDYSGEPDWTYVFTYDGDGNKTSNEVHWGDGETGDLFAGIYYSYEDGDLVTEENDEDGDGEIDSVIYREYDDPEGRITKEETDYNNDDEIDLTYTWEYIDPLP